MSKQWEYQLRIDLGDDLAEAARRDPNNPAIKPLADILTRHHATMKCQFDAFADYVAEAEKRGTKNYPLYAWTKATIENPEKKAVVPAFSRLRNERVRPLPQVRDVEAQGKATGRSPA